MDDALNNFLHITEQTTCSITPTVSKSLTYPFIYISKLTTTELEYLVERHTIERAKLNENYLPLYLKADGSGYRLLGYVLFCFDALIKLNQLRSQKIMIKADKTSEQDVSELVDSLLLT